MLSSDSGTREALKAAGKDSNLLLSIPIVRIYRDIVNILLLKRSRRNGTKQLIQRNKLDYLTKMTEYTLDSTKNCAKNSIPDLSVHEIDLNIQILKRSMIIINKAMPASEKTY